MATPQWREVAQPDTSRFLDVMARANQNTVQGIQTIGNAYNAFYNDLKKRNTNEMLTALNQATNPEELVQAQRQVAQLQQQYGNGYDLDQVRTAMDERPNILMQRQNAAMDFNDKRASLAARPEVNAAMIDAYRNAGMDTTVLERMASNGLDNSALAGSLFNTFTNNRDYTAQQANNAFNQQLALRGEARADKQLELSALSTQMQAANSIYDNYEPEKTVVNSDGSETTTGGGYSRYGQAMGIVGNILNTHGPKAAAMVHTESNFNPNAVSPKGASGIIQIMPATAKNPGYGMKPINLQTATPEQQIAWGMEYRNRIQKTHGFTEDQATAAYNAGAGKVQQAIAKGGKNWVNHLPAETRSYVQKVNTRERQYANNAGTQSQGPGIDRSQLNSIRSAYQKDLVEFNAKRGKADQKVNVNSVLAGLTAKSKGSRYTQDHFDIADMIQHNKKAASLSAEGITEVFNRLAAWQAKPEFLAMNTKGALGKSADKVIDEVLRTESANRKQMDKLEHPSVKYGLAIQQAFEAVGGSTSADNALKMLDSDLYAKRQQAKPVSKPKASPSAPRKQNTPVIQRSSSSSSDATARARELAKQTEANNAKRNLAKGVTPAKAKPVVKDNRISDVANTLFNPKPVKVPINQAWLEKMKK